MAFPIDTAPVLSQSELLDSLTEAEAGIAQCMAAYYCGEFTTEIVLVEDIEDQVELTKSLLCAYACKEKGIASVIDAIANKILADKGLVPGGGASEGCSCDC